MFASNTSQVSNGAVYVEDVFQSWLSTGNGTSRTVTGPDMTLGGLSITKSRSAATGWRWVDTARGAGLSLESNSTAAQATESTGVTAFTSTGTSIGSDADYNTNGATYVDYLLKKQPKFMTIATWTGNGAASQVINHDLGSVPGFIVVKAYSGSSATGAWWYCYHRSLGNTKAIALNSTDASTTLINFWRNTDPTSTQFTVGSVLNDTSTNFIAYVFAHNAGGFGLTGTDNVISCGSYTGNGSATGPVVTLGYEPQWLLIKNASASGNYWHVVDVMRGWTDGGNEATLLANTADAENGLTGAANYSSPTSTGFKIESASGEVNTSGATYIYIAIRRGPMKTPTSGTSVFAPVANSSATTPYTGTTGFPVDLLIGRTTTAGYNTVVSDRLRSNSQTAYANLFTNLTSAQLSGSGAGISYQSNTSFTDNSIIAGNSPNIYWNFRRAPGFFDVVCYTGTGANTNISHNLGAVPELMIVKKRSLAAAWIVYSASLGGTKGLQLNGTSAQTIDSTYWNNTDPTSSVFSVGTSNSTSGDTFVTYLFSSCPGVSKVGSYTGTGTTQQINCGFAAGARFVLIKRTSSTGDWYVWDSARGIVAGNDPYLLLNSTAAEVTTTDYIDTYSAGFEISSTAPAAINASGGSFIYLAIA